MKDLKGCDELVPEEGGRRYHKCCRKIVDGTKCKIHCAAAVAKRRARSEAHHQAKMAPKYRAWANQYIGARVRELVDDSGSDQYVSMVDLAEIIRKADEE